MTEGPVDPGPDRASLNRIQDQVDALNDLAWELRHSEAERARALSQEAQELSTSGPYLGQPYRHGLAASLLTLGFVNHQRGKIDAALAQCLEAAGYFETLPPSRKTVDCDRTISWIYYFLGDQGKALSYGAKALKLAQALSLRIPEASVLDLLATIYAATGDQTQAIQNQERALQIALDERDRVLEAVIRNNLALNLLAMGNLARALESAEKSLKISRDLALPEQELAGIDTLGQIFQKMGDTARAIEIASAGLEVAMRNHLQLGQVYCLLNLGKALLTQGAMEQAASHLQQGLEIASSIADRPHEMECHLALSEVAERMGDPAGALAHHKRFHALSEQFHRETGDQRVAALWVALQAETAQRDAEIYRMRATRLQEEINERKRVEAKLERLATRDPLTNLFSRPYFTDLAELEFERAHRLGRAFSVVMLDIDRFKAVNDTHGHSAGDRVLIGIADVLRKALRGADIVGRVGGDEFCAALPETNGDQARKACDRLKEKLREQPLETASGPLTLTVSIGIASLSEGESPVGERLSGLLERADAALYAAKQKGRDRIEIAGPAAPSPIPSSK